MTQSAVSILQWECFRKLKMILPRNCWILKRSTGRCSTFFEMRMKRFEEDAREPILELANTLSTTCLLGIISQLKVRFNTTRFHLTPSLKVSINKMMRIWFYIGKQTQTLTLLDIRWLLQTFWLSRDGMFKTRGLLKNSLTNSLSILRQQWMIARLRQSNIRH